MECCFVFRHTDKAGGMGKMTDFHAYWWNVSHNGHTVTELTSFSDFTTVNVIATGSTFLCTSAPSSVFILITSIPSSEVEGCPSLHDAGTTSGKLMLPFCKKPKMLISTVCSLSLQKWNKHLYCNWKHWFFIQYLIQQTAQSIIKFMSLMSLLHILTSTWYKVMIREEYTKAHKHNKFHQRCVYVCGVKIQYCQLKLLKMFKI